MIPKLTALRILVLCCASVLPTLAWGDACQTTSVSNLIGTSCNIGDVTYAFGNSAFSSESVINSVTGPGITASSLILTPDSSDPQHPSFTISGPLIVTAVGLGNSTQQMFTLLWTATPTSSSVVFGSATNTLINTLVPGTPSFGLVSAGNNLGDPSFTNAIVQTGGPNLNPDSTSLDSFASIPLDGLFANLFASDGTGLGATASVDGLSYQYDMVPVPEPLTPVLLVGFLAFLLIKKLRP